MEIKRDNKFVINVNLKFSREAPCRHFLIRKVFSNSKKRSCVSPRKPCHQDLLETG